MKKLIDIAAEIGSIFKNKWETRQGQKVPNTEDINLGNNAVKIDAVILYADLKDSTNLVKNYKDWFAAKIYKSYILGACEVIKNNNGVITSFDGDRVMGIYFGGSKNSNAAKSALQINYIVKNVINKKIKDIYPKSSYVVNQSVGIDSSDIFVARTGVRGDNDLVWVGNAANMAAKMCTIRNTKYCSFISKAVYDCLSNETKFRLKDNACMWESFFWDEYGISLYGSTWWWEPN